jgi:hypothetical protein
MAKGTGTVSAARWWSISRGGCNFAGYRKLKHMVVVDGPYACNGRVIKLVQLPERSYRRCAMPALPQKTLKIVLAPLAIDAVAKVPPVLEVQNPTVEYNCGRCGAVLMRADENKPPALMVHCTLCDAFNSTED